MMMYHGAGTRRCCAKKLEVRGGISPALVLNRGPLQSETDHSRTAYVDLMIPMMFYTVAGLGVGTLGLPRR